MVQFVGWTSVKTKQTVLELKGRHYWRLRVTWGAFLTVKTTYKLLCKVTMYWRWGWCRAGKLKRQKSVYKKTEVEETSVLMAYLGKARCVGRTAASMEILLRWRGNCGLKDVNTVDIHCSLRLLEMVYWHQYHHKVLVSSTPLGSILFVLNEIAKSTSNFS